MLHCLSIMVNVLDICAKMRVQAVLISFLLDVFLEGNTDMADGVGTKLVPVNVLSCWELSIAARPHKIACSSAM